MTSYKTQFFKTQLYVYILYKQIKLIHPIFIVNSKLLWEVVYQWSKFEIILSKQIVYAWLSPQSSIPGACQYTWIVRKLENSCDLRKPAEYGREAQRKWMIRESVTYRETTEMHSCSSATSSFRAAICICRGQKWLKWLDRTWWRTSMAQQEPNTFHGNFVTNYHLLLNPYACDQDEPA